MAKFTNQASLTYNGLTTNSNIVNGEITDILNAYKDAVVSEYKSGDLITYVINLQNTSTGDLTNLTITDDLGAYPSPTPQYTPLDYQTGTVLYYSDGVKQASPTANIVNNELVITGITVKANKSSQIIYNTVANEYAPLGTAKTIDNTATITGTGLAGPVEAKESILSDTTTDLSVTKSICPSAVVTNGEVTYTFVIENYGAITDITDVTNGLGIADTFNPKLDAVAVTLDGSVWPATEGEAVNYTYDAATGEFATTNGRIQVPAATYQQGADGKWTITPGVKTLTVTGNITNVTP